jgi:hypothetical protein
MKPSAFVATIAISMGALLPTFAADGPEAAEAAAQTWLGLVDAGDYRNSWLASAKIFRDAVPQSQWVTRIATVRGPLGAVKSRRPSTVRIAHSLPGVPDGEYVVIEFSTSVEHKVRATETVTPMKDTDGHWRVSGYFVR